MPLALCPCAATQNARAIITSSNRRGINRAAVMESFLGPGPYTNADIMVAPGPLGAKSMFDTIPRKGDGALTVVANSFADGTSTLSITSHIRGVELVEQGSRTTSLRQGEQRQVQPDTLIKLPRVRTEHNQPEFFVFRVASSDDPATVHGHSAPLAAVASAPQAPGAIELHILEQQKLRRQVDAISSRAHTASSNQPALPTKPGAVWHPQCATHDATSADFCSEDGPIDCWSGTPYQHYDGKHLMLNKLIMVGGTPVDSSQSLPSSTDGASDAGVDRIGPMMPEVSRNELIWKASALQSALFTSYGTDYYFLSELVQGSPAAQRRRGITVVDNYDHHRFPSGMDETTYTPANEDVGCYFSVVMPPFFGRTTTTADRSRLHHGTMHPKLWLLQFIFSSAYQITTKLLINALISSF